MNLDDLTLREIKELRNIFSSSEKTEVRNEGFCVVCLDQRFIFIGELIISGDWGIIKKARCLRSWSSGKGLEWHIENGKKDCVTDGNGTDRKFHISKLQNWANTDENKW